LSHRVEKGTGGGGHGLDGRVERGAVRAGRLAEAADLADELQCGVAQLATAAAFGRQFDARTWLTPRCGGGASGVASCFAPQFEPARITYAMSEQTKNTSSIHAVLCSVWITVR
jgi:hypothetical protein